MQKIVRKTFSSINRNFLFVSFLFVFETESSVITLFLCLLFVVVCSVSSC